MKNALVIAAREFEEKRFVVYAAVAFAVLPFILAAIPGVAGKSPRDVLAMSSLIFGTTFAVAVGVISGASFIGRDLSDGRMSFYFSRPAGSLSIWFGKLTAGILMIVGTFGFIIIPARLAAGERWTRMISSSSTWSVLYLLTIAIALFLIAHVISTFARSRSPLIIFDFVAAVICGVSVLFLFRPLIAGEASGIVAALKLALAIAAAFAVIFGGAWQLERGRTDRRRNHLALSQFLWATMAVALLIAAGYVGWVVSAQPGDLTSPVEASRSPSGPFVVISGNAKGRADYRAAFLLNVEDGSKWRLDPRARWGVRYTRNGRSAVVPRLSDNAVDMLVYTRGNAEPVDTGLTTSDRDFFVSDDGGRIATISYKGVLSVYDVAQKRSLVSVRLPDAKFMRAFFVTPDLIRIYLNLPDLKIEELDVRARALRETGSVPSQNFVMAFPDPSVTHMLVHSFRSDALTLNDARTGAAIKTLSTGARLKHARYLRDGRIAFVDGPDSAAVLHILGADGTPQRDILLGARKWMTILGDDGTRVVLNDVDAASGHPMFEAVNITSGVVEHREPVHDSMISDGFDMRPPIEPLREVLDIDAQGHIVAWNPATGGKRMITGG
jgi:low affinity Fe/Cu permease